MMRKITIMSILCMLLSLSVPIVANAQTPSDIADHWAKAEIEDWIAKGYISGYLDGSFKPNSDISRAEFISMINKSYGYTALAPISFSDVKPSSWYYEAVAIAASAGYISGYTDGTMRPEIPISREEAAAIIVKLLKLQPDMEAATKFKDHLQLTWSRGAVGAVAKAGIMNGYLDGSFQPRKEIERGEAVVSLTRAIGAGINMNAPLAPALTMDDDTNLVTGMTTAMEYKLDSADWVMYNLDIFKSLDLSGNHTLLVRYAAQGAQPAGPSTTLEFTEEAAVVAVRSGGGGTSSNVNITGITISGTAEFNSTLNADLQPSSASATYQWERSDRVDGIFTAITGATSSTYVVVEEDVGMFLRVMASGTGNYKGSVTSSPTTVVKVVNLTDVKISGTAQFGSTLSAVIEPAGATASYQWQRAAAEGGPYTNISGAAGSSYVIGAADVDQYLRVMANGRDGYAESVTSSPTLKVTAISLTKVTISGTAQFGSTLSAVIEPAGATASYQWQRAAAEGGPYIDISGAAGSSYVIGAADVDQYLRVMANGRDGYAESVTSSPTLKVTAISLTKVTISGTAQFGSTLSAVIEPAGATVTYQWERLNETEDKYEPISGATASGYTVSAEDLGRTLRVTATGTGGYAHEVPSSPILVQAPVNLTDVKITGTAQFGSTLNAVIEPAGATASYQWQSAAAEGGPYIDISGATGSSYVIGAADVDQYLRVMANGTGGYAGEVTSSPPLEVTAISLTEVTISGTAQFGSTLSVVIEPAGATASYQWQRAAEADGLYTDISGATGNSYVIDAADVDQFLRVTANGTGGYAGKLTSSPTLEVTAISLTGVTISGTAQFGSTLNAAIEPAGATASYQWQRAAAADGLYTNISGATGNSYVIVAADVDQYLRVTATGRDGYAESVTSSPTSEVTAISLTEVTISGPEEMGATLEADVLPEGATVNYQWQWLDPEVQDGVYSPIPGATARTYRVTSDYLGDYIRVSATGTSGYEGTVTSLPTEAIANPTIIFSRAIVREGSGYFDKDEVDAVMEALWGEVNTPVNINTDIGQIEIKQVFSTTGNGNLTIDADNITADFLNWLEYGAVSGGRIAVEIKASNGVELYEAANANDNIINGSEGTDLINLYVNYPDWEDVTVRVDLHDLVAGTNTGRIELSDNSLADFQVVTEGALIHVNSIEVTSTSSSISTDGGELQLVAEVGPDDAYDKIVRWSVEPGEEFGLISNTGVLYAGRNGTVEVFATSADTGLRSEPYTVTITGQVGPAAPTGVGKTDETVAGANDGTLTGVAPGQEYQVNGTGGWIKITGNTVTGLAPGSYTVRVAKVTSKTYIEEAGTPTEPIIIAAGKTAITGFEALDDIPAGTAGSALYADVAEVLAILPESVTANPGAVTVKVASWTDTDTYVSNTAGSYTFTANLGVIPEGYVNAEGYTATVEVVVEP
ncbi:S-layer homology domain-containing protein [Acidaminobacter hydrogenoformans]|uniref:Ig-like domain (Group 2) n=1 Tax=Acidaminobacter hydrogenoformans DSM 2784 TaxID=1120920 RepID=A0A1G5RQ11_9FIRM|nr:S-layer homology domain-containing protein [Acidaminobacter hydrogenoformans]SCZ76046.1 Ig-like domain (group 2) [Acidaminobacter hydrogenoformans DSM 2784]